MARCTAKKGGYSETQCESLKLVAKPFSKQGKGLLYSSRVNIKTSEKLGVSFAVNQNDENIVLSLCPFCGGELRDLDKSEVEFLAKEYAEIVTQK